MDGGKEVPRYSLKALILSITLFCVLLAVVSAAPELVSVLLVALLLLVSIPAVLGGMVYLRGYPQAFFVGAAVPTSWLAMGMVLGRLEALALIAFLNPEFWR